MFIEIHEFKCSIRTLTDTDLAELLDILGIPDNKYTRKKNYKTGNLASMEYGFGTSGQSVFIRLGEYNDQYIIDPATRQLTGRNSSYGPCGVRYRPYVYLQLHGSFFDNSPNFSLSRLLRFLDRIGYTPQNLDVAYCDDQQVTTEKDWLRVFASFPDYCIGNVRNRGKITVLKTNGLFEKVNIGNASSKTAYGTLYRRPEYFRLEFKYRDSADISYLLANYSDDDRQAFEADAVDMLITNLDIVTKKSRQTQVPAKYKREKFYKAFLGSEPVKLSKSAIKAEKQENRNKSDDEKYERRLKRIAGSLTNLAREFSSVKTLEDISKDLNILLPSGLGFSPGPLS